MIGMIGRGERLGSVSPAVLAMACRGLIASARFAPKPAELRKACQKAEAGLLRAAQTAGALVEVVGRADAVLLQFDREQWERPYLLPEYRPLLDRMLGRHAIFGDGSPEWDKAAGSGWDDDGTPLHPFERLVADEWAKLALPAPEDTSEQPPPPMTSARR